MVNSTNLLIVLSTLLSSQIDAFSMKSTPASISTSTTSDDRRSFLSRALLTVPSLVIGTTVAANNPLAAIAAVSTAALKEDLETSITKIEGIPELLDNGEWDKVRTILKTPPVNKLWNLGESQNTLTILAKATGEFELLELKDELAISLQICDQLTYDNAFVYFQPGNGKVKIKEPKDLAKKSIGQIQEAIKVSGI